MSGCSDARRVVACVSAMEHEAHGTAGFYCELPPAPDLHAVIACAWIKVVGNANSIPAPILPDGCADILACAGDAPFVVGPDAVTRWVALPDRLVIAGLRIRPGAVRALLGVSASELLGRSADLTDVVSSARWLGAALDAAVSPIRASRNSRPGCDSASPRARSSTVRS